MHKFSENCTRDILTPYLDGLVGQLIVLVQVISYINCTSLMMQNSHDCVLLKYYFTCVSTFMSYAVWDTNGASGNIDCCGICCCFMSGIFLYNMSSWMCVLWVIQLDGNGICRSIFKNTMMMSWLTWELSWWMPLLRLMTCFGPSPWSVLDWLVWLLERRNSGMTLSW